MHCLKCNNDLAECVCPDLKERFESVKNCKFLLIGAEYTKRIEQQIQRNETNRQQKVSEGAERKPEDS